MTSSNAPNLCEEIDIQARLDHSMMQLQSDERFSFGEA